MKILKQNSGFMLLEFLIAFAILTIILSSVYMAQSSTLMSANRTRSYMIATNLARNFISQTELKYEGQKFENLPKTESGDFPAPFNQYRWTREVSEVDFTAMTEIFLSQMKSDQNGGVKEEENTVAKLFEAYLKNSIRKLVLTIEWKEGEGSQKLAFTSLLVNYDAEFAPGI